MGCCRHAISFPPLKENHITLKRGMPVCIHYVSFMCLLYCQFLCMVSSKLFQTIWMPGIVVLILSIIGPRWLKKKKNDVVLFFDCSWESVPSRGHVPSTLEPVASAPPVAWKSASPSAWGRTWFWVNHAPYIPYMYPKQCLCIDLHVSVP